MSFRSSLPSLFLPVLLLASAPGNTAANNAVNRAVRLSLAESFVTANLLTSGDAVRFGFWDFDPNTLLNLNDDNFGSLESQELRQRITTFSLPYTWQTPLAETGNTLTLGAKAAYVENAQETQIISSTSQAKDEIKSSVSSLSAGAAFSRRLSTHWDITFSTYAHWMRYRNDTQFNTADSQAIAPAINGLITNYNADAWLLEPSSRLTYFIGGEHAEVQLFSDIHYVAGRTFNIDHTAHDVAPEAWYWSHGARWKHPFVTRILPGQNVWMQASRYDLGGDLEGSLGNHYYYEAGVGWLLDMGNRIPFVDNIGFGINLNYGSLLRGGTLVLLFNEG